MHTERPVQNTACPHRSLREPASSESTAEWLAARECKTARCCHQCQPLLQQSNSPKCGRGIDGNRGTTGVLQREPTAAAYARRPSEGTATRRGTTEGARPTSH